MFLRGVWLATKNGKEKVMETPCIKDIKISREPDAITPGSS
jgi:hypothetical protein